MVCPKCNSELPEQSTYCNKCGTNIEKYNERKFTKIAPFSIVITLLIIGIYVLLTSTTNIKFENSNVELYVGDTHTFNITLEPDYARNKDYLLSTDNKDIITIEKDTIKAKKSGNAKISLKQNNKVFDICTVTVKDIEPTNIEFANDFESILIGREIQPPIVFTPAETTDKKINYSISDESIAEIKDGKIIGKKEGSIEITATHLTQQLETSIKIKVLPIQPEEISIKNNEILYIGDTITLDIVSTPPDITYKDYNINSSNKNVLEVKGSELTAKKAGKSTISVTHKSGAKTTKEFEIKPVDVSSVKITTSNTTLNVGDKLKVEFEILPEKATDKSVTWEPSDKTIATIDKTGTISAKAPGDVTITITASNGKTDSKKFTIKPKPVSVSNGFIKKPSGSREAPVTIHAPTTSNCYVYFKNINNNSNSFSMYVAKNTTCEVNAPIGTYELYYATGTTWYGSKYKFGDGTGYFKADKTFTFYYLGNYVYGTEVTLYSVYNGNMGTDPISESAFPD